MDKMDTFDEIAILLKSPEWRKWAKRPKGEDNQNCLFDQIGQNGKNFQN